MYLKSNCLYYANCVVLFIAIVFSCSASYAHYLNKIVGSSTVYPFTSKAVEEFKLSPKGEIFNYLPAVEKTGTGGGFNIFCSANSSILHNASRTIKPDEASLCKKNGISYIRLQIGYDAIVFVINQERHLSLTTVDVFLALSNNIFDEKGNLKSNNVSKWSEIRSELPDDIIEVMGPGSSSGTRDMFIKKVFLDGCKKYAVSMGINTKICNNDNMHLRTSNSIYIEAGEQDNLIVKKVMQSKTLVGILGYNYYLNNIEHLNSVVINGIELNSNSINNHTYPVIRPLFLYANTDAVSVNPSVKQLLQFFISQNVVGKNGVLSKIGLIPLSASDINNQVEKIKKIK